ncbi:MAG: hypothetical protein WCC48_02165, partial [Anaeromyxobacteraceae bacterium]
VVTAERASTVRAPFVAVAGLRVGGAVLFAIAQQEGDPSIASQQLLDWLRGASPTREEDRRRP